MVFIAGCAPKPEEEVSLSKGIVITDEMGRKAAFTSIPGRIVVLTGYPAEVICALKEGERIVGICNPEGEYIPELRKKPSVGKSTVTPNLERIIELKPDLVIAYQWTEKEVIEKLERAEIRVLCFRVWTLAETLQFIEKMGKLLGREKEANQLKEFINSKIDMIREKTEGIPVKKKPSIFCEVFKPYQSTAQGENSMKTPWGKFMYKSPTQIQIEIAGGINCVGRQPVRSPIMSPEWVVEKDPDIIIKIPWVEGVGSIPSLEAMKAIRDEIMHREGLNLIKAVKEGRVYIIHSKLCAGPRQVIGTCYKAKWFHPELFPDLLPKAVHKEMLKRFWKMELQGTWTYPEELNLPVKGGKR